MDKEQAAYISTFFPLLLTENESKAFKHQQAFSRLSKNKEKSDQRSQIYYNEGWLSKDPAVLNLLEKGYEEYEITIAKRILDTHPDKIFLNTCPNCGKLARTPSS